MKTETCSGCRYWDDSHIYANKGQTGACKAHPPRAPDSGREAIFPVIAGTELACGAFKSRTIRRLMDEGRTGTRQTVASISTRHRR